MNEALLIQWFMGGFLALQAWMLSQIYSMNRKLAASLKQDESEKEKSRLQSDENLAAHKRVEEKLDQVVSRREFELNITQLRSDITMLQAKVGELNLAIRALELRIVEVELTVKRGVAK